MYRPLLHWCFLVLVTASTARAQQRNVPAPITSSPRAEQARLLHQRGRNLRTAGIVTTALGGVLALTGIVLLVTLECDERDSNGQCNIHDPGRNKVEALTLVSLPIVGTGLLLHAVGSNNMKRARRMGFTPAAALAPTRNGALAQIGFAF